MPRKDPRSTKLEKYERWTTFAPSQRMSESSRNSMSTLARNRRHRIVTGEPLVVRFTAGCTVGVPGFRGPGSQRLRRIQPHYGAGGNPNTASIRSEITVERRSIDRVSFVDILRRLC